jgi:trehalose/maltose hydrolase-like predicted phosphorylase
MHFRKLLLPFCLLSLITFASDNSSSSFVLQTTEFKPYTPGFIGNGHFSLVTTPLGITNAESYMAWVYDHGADDIPRIAVIPAWNGIDIKSDNVWLSSITPSQDKIRSYSQQINMYDGSLDTKYQWIDGDHSIDVDTQAFVSRANPHLAAVRLTITPHYTGNLELKFDLSDWPAPKRLPLEKLEKLPPDPTNQRSEWYAGNMIVKNHDVQSSGRVGRGSMVSTAEGRDTTVVQVMEARWPSGLKQIKTTTDQSENSVSIHVQFVAENKPYTFYKFVGVASSRDGKDPMQIATTAVDSTKARAYELIFAEHTKAWHDLWNTDIVIEGNPELQRLVHSCLFYLLSSVDKDTDFSIPPMALSSHGYYGHIFWDADTWMFPPLLVMYPDLAKSMVNFRYRTLDAAQHKAKDLGFRGAMYPWEGDEIGNETTPQFAYQNALGEIHVTGDVAVAQWQYYLATGDQKWLKEVGFPVIQQTADFWVSRSTFNSEKNRYDIQKVVSVDEGLIGISNDSYTNAVAKRNLEIALKASRVQGLSENSEWKKIADALYIPYNEAGEFHPSYENAPESTLGSVVPLLSYPLEVPMSENDKKNNLTNAVKRQDQEGSGAMMGETLFPVIAAELGDRKTFDRLIPITYQGYLRPPYNVLSETPKNNSTNFVTGAGGFLQQVIFGYTGLRLNEDGLTKKFSPMLPTGVTRLNLKNFRVRNKRFDFEVKP